MKHIFNLAAATILVAMPVPSIAQNSDYIRFGGYATEVAKTLTSIQSCKRMGFDVNDGDGIASEISSIATREAVMMGIDKSTAEAMLLDALNREKADMELISSLPKHIDTTEELIEQVRDTFLFWDTRCRALSSAGFGSNFIRETGNEASVQQKSLEKLIADIRSTNGVD